MDLLKDNIPKLVRKLAVPAMVGTLFQTLYNVVDTFFAGKISPEALSAYEGKEIVVGIRPEAFEDSVYANEKEFSEQVSIEISLLEQLGSDTYVHFYKDIKPGQTEAIEEILADEGEDISVLGTQTKFIARINPNATIEEGQNRNVAGIANSGYSRRIGQTAEAVVS